MLNAPGVSTMVDWIFAYPCEIASLPPYLIAEQLICSVDVYWLGTRSNNRTEKERGIMHSLLKAAKCKFSERRPKSASMFSEGRKVMPGGNTRSVLHYDPFPIAMVRGEGPTLWDADGHAYIDFLGEFTAGLFGHSNALIRTAITNAMADGISLSAQSPYEIELANLLVTRFASIDLVRFTNSGTEANLMALSLARAATGRNRILVFKGSYHGGVLSFLNGRSTVNVPHDFIYGDYNAADATRALIAENAEDLAAVLVEPMLGAAGCLQGTREFLSTVQEAAKKASALFILDEIQTSRLAFGGRQEQLGLSPDITTLGKYIGGGSSIGAFGGNAELMNLFAPDRPNALQHAGTFNNNVISMAAGTVGLRDIYTKERAKELNQQGDCLRERLNLLCRAYQAPLQFIGLGSLMNAHATSSPIVQLKDIQNTDTALRDLLFFFLADHGYYIARRGFITLNLELKQTHIDGLCEAVEAFLDLYQSEWLVP